MILSGVPEIADGGYWYLVQSVPDPVEGGLTPGDIPGVGWCAWYAEIDGIDYAAVRCPEPVTGVLTVSTPVSDVLVLSGYTGKPFGRIGGS